MERGWRASRNFRVTTKRSLSVTAIVVLALCVGVKTLSTGPAAPETAGAAGDMGRIAFSRDDGALSDDVFIVDLATTRVRRLTAGKRKEWDPDLSPNGRRIVYRRNPDPTSDAADIWVMSADGRSKRNLTRSPRDDNWSPAWSPDGTRIAFSSKRGGGEPSIWVMSANGRGSHHVAAGPGEYPDWSPDGNQLVFAAARTSGTYDIYTVRLDGTDLKRLTQDPATDFAPVWSPDGKTIAFQSDRDDRWHVWLMDADGSNQRRLPHGEEEGAWPAWISAGRLAYAGDGLVIVNIDGSQERRLNLRPRGAELLSFGP